jgi:hypothetical protein
VPECGYESALTCDCDTTCAIDAMVILLLLLVLLLLLLLVYLFPPAMWFCVI